MAKIFPSNEFFQQLRERIDAEPGRFTRLGWFDVTFGLRVLPGSPVERPRSFVLRFETTSCVEAHEVPDQAPPELDFVLEAPLPVWNEMLASLGADGEVDAAHTINTLTHHDHPMRVTSLDPLGHDKLFRYQESIQQVFHLAAAVASDQSDGPGERAST